MKNFRTLGTIATLLLFALAATGCGIFKKNKDPDYVEVDENLTSAIGVNGYLWRASLDALANLPIAQTDSAGGVIITDWFSDPAVPQERLKVTVMISDMRLRADALNVSVNRQEMIQGVWVNGAVQEGTEKRIEDTILTRARDLWIQQLDQ